MTTQSTHPKSVKKSKQILQKKNPSSRNHKEKKRNKKPSNKRRVKVKEWGINGEGIAYENGRTIFIEGAVPGEYVEIELTGHFQGYSTAKLLRVFEPSPRRRKAMCPHQKYCGGCDLMHLDYRGQLQMKSHILAQSLKKYAGYKGPIEKIEKNPFPTGYRNAIKLPYGQENGKVQSGMYKRNSNHFVGIDSCLVHQKDLEKIRKAIDVLVSEYHLKPASKSEPGLYSLVLKAYDNKVYVILVTSDLKLNDELVQRILDIPEVGGLWQNIRSASQPDHELFGKTMIHLGKADHMELALGSLKLSLGPRSFFQLNTAQALNLYNQTAEWLSGADHVVEAYCGVGAISLMVSTQANKVTGIEQVDEAVDYARINAQNNGRDNVRFICGDAAQKLEEILKEEPVDALIVDPPRSGLDQKMIETILKSNIGRILYISCNPSTLAKNVRDLSGQYRLVRVKPFDLFSQSPHVESLNLLERIESSQTQE